MKKFLIALICLCLLLTVGGCGEGNIKESRLIDGSVEYTVENLPKLCVTELTKNQGVNLVSAVLGVDTEAAEKFIVICDTTDDCYLKLADGECDIVIAHHFGKAVTQKLTEVSLTLNETELQKDALVFITNGKVGVNDLTLEQLTALFKGETVNWNALGGADLAVTLFGGSDKSATENAFEKHISPEITVPAVTKTIVTENGEYFTEIDYDNRDGAVGYTLLSLAGNYNGNSIKPLSVDGVAPTYETVQSGQYTLTIPINVSIRSTEAEDSNIKILYNWIISEQGRAVAGLFY